MKTLTNSTQAQYIAAATSNPQKPYFTTTYRDDLIRFENPTVNETLASEDGIPFSFAPATTGSFYVAGFDASMKLRGDLVSGYTAAKAAVSGLPIISSLYPSLRGSWANGLYYFAEHYVDGNTTPGTMNVKYYQFNPSTNSRTEITQVTGIPTLAWTPEIPAVNGNTASATSMNGKRISAFLVMESGDKLIVLSSYRNHYTINQKVCTTNFYHAPSGSWSFQKLRTIIQYEVPDFAINGLATVLTQDQSASRIAAVSFESKRFFVVANDGTKAVRFLFNNGVEGMLEPVVPIDLDANRLEITDSLGQKTYGKYNQFLPTSVCKIGSLYYMNGQMIRTYSNGDRNVMEVFLTSKACSAGDRASGEIDGMNWSIGEQSFFIDSKYYTKANASSVRLCN